MIIRDNNFKLDLKEGSIKDYEKIILSEVNDIFMPMGFVSYEKGEIVSYNCSGFSSLKQCHITEVLEALDILERTFSLVGRASEYLISPNKITLSTDTIFYDRESGKVRIAYVPVDRDNASLRENIAHFITEVKMNLQETERTYVETVKTQLEDNNYYIKDLINVIGEIKRKAVKELTVDEVV